MEFSEKEVVPFTYESEQNLSADSGNIDSKHEISEIIQTTSSNSLPEIYACNEQEISAAAHSDCMEADLKTNCLKITNTVESSADDLELNKHSDKTPEHSEVVAQKTIQEVTQITEKYEEYTSITQPEGEDAQSDQFVSNYVLETDTASVYVSEEVQDGTLGASESVYQTVVISDDDNQSSNVPEEADQHNIAVPDDTNQNEANGTNWISEYSSVSNEDVSQLQQSDNDPHNIKNEVIKSNTEDNIENVVERENENEDEYVANEVSQDSNVNVNTEKIVNTSGEDQCSYDVKQEMNAMVVNETNTVGEKEHGTDDINESMDHEQIFCPNNELVENCDLGNESTTTENMSVEGYTVAEGMEMTEIQEGEYTIVEGPSSLDISTSHPNEPDNSDGTLVLLQSYENSEDNRLETIVDEPNEMYLSELRNQAESRQSVSSQSSEGKRRRGRKPTQDIPMHVLGHDISKPVENFPNGRALPKPRLGVKVPYRNLTSQIVSKAEIEKEVMERARLKQEQTNSRGDLLFARKLTQRLARKIAPSPDPRKHASNKKSKQLNVQPESELVREETNEMESNQNQDNSKIHNDSDLLAILEGEGDEMPVLPKEVPQPQADESNLKLIEREIALQQLHDLPNQAPKSYRGRLVKAPVLTAEASLTSKTKSSNKSSADVSQTSTKTKTDQPVHVLSDKENETVKQVSKEGSSISPKKDSNADILSSPKKQPVEIEPQVKVNMVLKTYSRKRKTTELPDSPIESPLPKKPTLSPERDMKGEKSDAAAPTNVYVTKSSRVIKKKVIWDPDETPIRSPKSTIKADSQSPKITTTKAIKSAEKISNSEKGSNSEKVSEKSEKSVKEKFTEKKSIEKISQKKSAPSPSEKKIEITKSKTPLKNKKTRSEVDKLLMDEGAVKMLYELKNTDESTPKKKKDVYSVEKAHKEIMKKANEIKSDLQQNTNNESPKFLRKKDTFTPSPVKPVQITSITERKMSKDSTRSSVHTPPGSPAYSQSSMLVRRRSSSSISSSDEIDGSDVSKISKKKSLTNSLESVKSKKIKKNEVDEQSEKLSEVKEPFATSTSLENKSPYKSFTIKKMSKHATIDLNYINENSFCTLQVLEELTLALKKIAKDKDCIVVSITSNCKAFCLGLDYTILVSENEEIRKKNANELAEKVRDFLLCLLKFPKVLIAGIQGDCVGLGVTMLPLFDMVISSDVATFSTQYANLGCVAEAGFLLSLPIFTNHGLAAELLYTTQKLTADDAFRRGLVTKLCWPEKYNETLINIVTSISRGSKQSLESTKKDMRSHLVQTTEAAINSLPKVLVEHWVSLECQKSFAQIQSGN